MTFLILETLWSQVCGDLRTRGTWSPVTQSNNYWSVSGELIFIGQIFKMIISLKSFLILPWGSGQD